MADTPPLLVVTILSIHRRGQRRLSLVACAQLVWHGQCATRIGAPASHRVLVGAAAAAHWSPGRRMRQYARWDTLERCGCGAAADSLRAASVGDVRGCWQHSQSSMLRLSAKVRAQRSQSFSTHQIGGVATLYRLHSRALGAQPVIMWTCSLGCCTQTVCARMINWCQKHECIRLAVA